MGLDPVVSTPMPITRPPRSRGAPRGREGAAHALLHGGQVVRGVLAREVRVALVEEDALAAARGSRRRAAKLGAVAASDDEGAGGVCPEVYSEGVLHGEGRGARELMPDGPARGYNTGLT
jgi:hypothetical protein